MTLRLTTLWREVRFRLGNSECHRCFYSKEAKRRHPLAVRNISKKFTAQDRQDLMLYIMRKYRGYDKRLEGLLPIMDKVFNYTVKIGKLKSLDDLVNVVGLSESEASQLCERILHIYSKKIHKMEVSYPEFTTNDSQGIESILAIHTSLYCISWAHMEVSGRLRSWQKELLPTQDGFTHPIDCVQQVMELHCKLPRADAYILETPSAQRARDKSLAVNNFMLCNINCALLSLISCLHINDGTTAKIYYLNRIIVPRLFGLDVGGEIVARLNVVEKLINQQNVDWCGSDILMDDWLIAYFSNSSDVHKEELAIPFLAAVAAMEVLVRRNDKAIRKATRAI